MRRLSLRQFTGKVGPAMPQENCRRESSGPEPFLDFWRFVELVLHLGQQNVYFQSRCIVRIDLNRQRNTYRDRIPPSDVTR